MRDLFKGLFVALGLIMLLSFGDVLMSSRMFLDTPRVHVVQEGEYFSQLARDYYGDADYWRALALINRAPNKDLIFPGERIILPSKSAVVKVAKSYKLSEVNEIVETQQTMASLEAPEEAREFTNRTQVASPEETEQAVGSTSNTTTTSENENIAPSKVPTESFVEEDNIDDLPLIPATDSAPYVEESKSTFASKWAWVIGLLVAFFAVGIGYIYYRRKNEDKYEPEIDASPIDSFTMKDDKKETDDRKPEFIDPVTSDIFNPVKRRDAKEEKKDLAAV